MADHMHHFMLDIFPMMVTSSSKMTQPAIIGTQAVFKSTKPVF